MGYSLSWVGINGRTPDDVQAELGLSRTGKFVEYGDGPLSVAMLPSGWFLLVARGCEHAMLRSAVLERLSAKAIRVVACSIEEHVMCCSAEEWSDGARLWRAAHDAQKGILHLSSDGTLPAGFDELRFACADQQRAEGRESAGVDYYFEIPLETAK
jgi:hypothetical protein